MARLKGNGYFFRSGDRDLGPWTRQEMRDFLIQGTINCDSPVRPENQELWRLARDYPELGKSRFPIGLPWLDQKLGQARQQMANTLCWISVVLIFLGSWGWLANQQVRLQEGVGPVRLTLIQNHTDAPGLFSATNRHPMMIPVLAGLGLLTALACRSLFRRDYIGPSLYLLCCGITASFPFLAWLPPAIRHASSNPPRISTASAVPGFATVGHSKTDTVKMDGSTSRLPYAGPIQDSAANIIISPVLQAIMGEKPFRKALISGLVFSEGELRVLSSTTEHCGLRCLEIREGSVLVQREGSDSTHELFLETESSNRSFKQQEAIKLGTTHATPLTASSLAMSPSQSFITQVQTFRVSEEDAALVNTTETMLNNDMLGVASLPDGTEPALEALKADANATAIPQVRRLSPETERLVRQIVLHGMTGSKPDRKALINDFAVGAGESASLNIEGKIVVVRCIEIRDRSVVVTVAGQSQPIEIVQGGQDSRAF